MSNVRGQAASQGDIMRRLHALERQMELIRAAPSLQGAHVGRGGLRLSGGRLLAEDVSGDPVFRVDTDPADIFMRKSLLRTLALEIFGEAVQAKDFFAVPNTFTEDLEWEEIEDLLPGLELETEHAALEVEVGGTRMLVFMSGDLQVIPEAGSLGRCEMAYELVNTDTGDRSGIGNNNAFLRLGKNFSTSAEEAPQPHVGTLTRPVLHANLQPNTTYRLELFGRFVGTGTEGTASVTNPSLIAIPF